MFLLIPAHPGSRGQRAVKQLLLLLSHARVCSVADCLLVFIWFISVSSTAEAGPCPNVSLRD